MIKISDKSECCGCSACASVCAHNAITMKPDAMGFLYPEVDVSKCIECGLCEKVCAFNDDYDKSLNLSVPEAYGARHKDMSEVETSRSGAAFIAISDWILEQGGIVYGAGYADHFRVVHKRAVTKEERDEFKGSKYVQSDMGTIFRQVKQELRDGKIVLFSGTPCQTAGLNSYIGKKYSDNLYLVDIVCHGVPSPYIWRDYLSYIEKKYKKKVSVVNFRDKGEYGWAAHKETFIFEDGEKITPEQSPYTDLFYKHIMLRQSCGSCHYCITVRPSDITIADFWGVEKTNTEINKDNKGVSLLLVNTDKGRRVLEEIKNKLYLISAKLDDCLQPNLMHPTIVSAKSKEFELFYIKYGFIYVLKKYTKVGLKNKLINNIKLLKYKIHTCLRNLIK